MSIIIEPAIVQDAIEMVDVGLQAFAKDALVDARYMLSTASSEELSRYREWRIETYKARMNTPGCRYLKAVDDATHSIVGYVGLYEPSIKEGPKASIAAPLRMNSNLVHEMDAKLNAVKDKWVAKREDLWYVKSMAVHPEYQGRGVAARLLRCALKAPDRAGQDAYLEGTAVAQVLYKRCGFQVLEDVAMLDGSYTFSAMLRHPQGAQGP